jgi:hypothetical protein
MMASGSYFMVQRIRAFGPGSGASRAAAKRAKD